MAPKLVIFELQLPLTFIVMVYLNGLHYFMTIYFQCIFHIFIFCLWLQLNSCLVIVLFPFKLINIFFVYSLKLFRYLFTYINNRILTLLLPDVSVQFQSNQRAVAGRTFQLVGLDSQLPRRSFQLPRRTWTPFQFKIQFKC